MYRVTQNCTGCERCFNACPAAAIVMCDGKAHIDPQQCTLCGICAQVCLQNAIVQTEEVLPEPLSEKIPEKKDARKPILRPDISVKTGLLAGAISLVTSVIKLLIDAKANRPTSYKPTPMQASGGSAGGKKCRRQQRCRGGRKGRRF